MTARYVLVTTHPHGTAGDEIVTAGRAVDRAVALAAFTALVRSGRYTQTGHRALVVPEAAADRLVSAALDDSGIGGAR